MFNVILTRKILYVNVIYRRCSRQLYCKLLKAKCFDLLPAITIKGSTSK